MNLVVKGILLLCFVLVNSWFTLVAGYLSTLSYESRHTIRASRGNGQRLCNGGIISGGGLCGRQLGATSSHNLKGRYRRKAPRTGADIAASAQSLARRKQMVESEGDDDCFITNNNDNNNDDVVVVGNLSKLTEAIDLRLENHQSAGGLYHHSRDSMGALLGYNSKGEDSTTSRSRVRASQHDIVVVFGKALVDDQVTVEYASRLRTLAQEVEDLEPDLLCFCGGIAKGNHISNADAGFLFFKHLCATENISLEHVKIFIDRTSKNEGKALQHVANHILKEHLPEWLAVSLETESLTDEYGMQRRSPRKKVHLQFTLVSTEYHLCNLNDIHHRSPNQSLLRPIEMLRTFDRSHDDDDDDELVAFRHSTGPSAENKSGGCRINGIIDCSWCFMYSTYPYSYTRDEASAFMGKCFLLGEELKPLHVNLVGVVAEQEFLQRDNYVMAASIRHELVSLMEDLYKMGIRSRLRELTTVSTETVDLVLEGATLALGRCIDLLRPGRQRSKAEYTKSLKWLDHCMTQIHLYCDPDRPLDPSEWGTMGQPSDDRVVCSDNQQ